MPEGPEVKLTTEYLSNRLDGKVIAKWIILDGNDPVDTDEFDQFYDNLPMMVEEVKCKGKLIYMCCFNEFRRFYITHSMRMTGSWRDKPDVHSRWCIELENGTKLWFRDTRKYATLCFTENEEDFQTILNKLGPDIMGDEFTLPVWRAITGNHGNKNVTAFLMDQSVISGCGNYIKSEALYYAKVSPFRKVSSLTENESEKLYEALRVISRMSYMHKGMSLRDYADANGKKGFYEFELRIYGRSNAKRQKTSDGRMTYFDPKVQI